MEESIEKLKSDVERSVGPIPKSHKIDKEFGREKKIQYSTSKSFVEKIKEKTWIVYIILPLILIIILSISRPSFLYDEVKDKNNQNIRKFNFTKLITTSLILSAAIFASYFFYKKKFN